MKENEDEETVCIQETTTTLKCYVVPNNEAAETYTINGTTIVQETDPDFNGVYDGHGVIDWNDGPDWIKQSN